MDALEAVLTRRSTRRYSENMPERELIEKVIEAGRYAPSGGNNQTTHFIVFTDKNMLKEDETITGGLILGYPESGSPNREPLERKGNSVTWTE